MLTIRFNRTGKKNRPYFRIALQESTVAPGGKHIEVLGSYDPHMKQVALKADRIKYWISQGAQASDTVHNLLVAQGVIEDKKRAVKLPKKVAAEVKSKEVAETKVEEPVKEEIAKEETVA